MKVATTAGTVVHASTTGTITQVFLLAHGEGSPTRWAPLVEQLVQPRR